MYDTKNIFMVEKYGLDQGVATCAKPLSDLDRGQEKYIGKTLIPELGFYFRLLIMTVIKSV